MSMKKFIISCECINDYQTLVIYWYYSKNGGGWTAEESEAYLFNRNDIEIFLLRMKEASGLRPHMDNYTFNYKIIKRGE